MNTFFETYTDAMQSAIDFVANIDGDNAMQRVEIDVIRHNANAFRATVRVTGSDIVEYHVATDGNVAIV